MQYRRLGQTGIKVSPYCLGAMMFGALANAEHDDGVRIIHKALDFRRQLHRHGRPFQSGRI